MSGHIALPLCVDEWGGWRLDSVLKVKFGPYVSSIRTMRNCIFCLFGQCAKDDGKKIGWKIRDNFFC